MFLSRDMTGSLHPCCMGACISLRQMSDAGIDLVKASCLGIQLGSFACCAHLHRWRRNFGSQIWQKGSWSLSWTHNKKCQNIALPFAGMVTGYSKQQVLVLKLVSLYDFHLYLLQSHLQIWHVNHFACYIPHPTSIFQCASTEPVEQIMSLWLCPLSTGWAKDRHEI